MAAATDASSGCAIGVWNGPTAPGVGRIKLVGGIIQTWAAAPKETEVWDLLSSHADGWPAMSGTRCSKWKGPVRPAERPRPVIQRALNVKELDDDWILTDTALPELEPEDVDPTHQPDVYRTLSIKGNQEGMNQDVYIRGTDWAGNSICERLTFNGTGLVTGVKPFKTVDKITLPVRTAQGQMLRVGHVNKFGLYYPISGGGAVIQQARRAPGAPTYTIEDMGNVDAVYATVAVGPLLQDGYSFEWMILTSS